MFTTPLSALLRTSLSSSIAARYEGLETALTFKHPRDVIFLEGPLPRTSLGKVQKYELRTRLGVV
jgi:acyl-coenzyme A synthetase/AMP-(fatty) acid ligase